MGYIVPAMLVVVLGFVHGYDHGCDPYHALMVARQFAVFVHHADEQDFFYFQRIYLDHIHTYFAFFHCTVSTSHLHPHQLKSFAVKCVSRNLLDGLLVICMIKKIC